MQPLLDRKLLFVTGKGGVGKTTLAAAIATHAAESGRRVIVAEVGAQSRLAEMFGHEPPTDGVPIVLEPGLSSMTVDPDQALLEWLQTLGGRISGKILASSGTFQYFAAAAPGAKELVTMVKIARLVRGEGRKRPRYDLVVVDAPATGHALGMLASPRTFGAIARVGPISGQTRMLRELLEDETRTGYVAVALGTEMAVTETLELEQGLRRDVGRELDAVIVNALLPRRFNTEDLERLDALATDGKSNGTATLALAAAQAARTAHERARFQHNQLARLRRRRFNVVGVPFVWGAQLQLDEIRKIGDQVARKI
jgi:anion-transporting  ArsA/GET3 family ATPase